MRYDAPRGSDQRQMLDWAQRLTSDLNRYPDTGAAYPGPYANDGAAATAGVQIGSSYVDSAGVYRRRIA